MAGQGPIEVVETNALGTLFSGAVVLAAMAGVVGGIVGADAVAGVLGTGSTAGGVVAFLVVTAGVLGLLVAISAGKEVHLHRDRVEYTGGLLGVNARSVDYDAIELVVRKTTNGDRVFDTGTFSLVRPHGDNVDLWYLEDPDAAARVLAERVAPPREQIRSVSDRRRRTDHLWHHWPEDTDPPAEPVVEDEELADILDVDAGDLKLDAIDEAEAHDDFSDLGDLGDVAGDIGADAGDGGDGGDGGGGGGE